VQRQDQVLESERFGLFQGSLRRRKRNGGGP
jgi:hypothetical protein